MTGVAAKGTHRWTPCIEYGSILLFYANWLEGPAEDDPMLGLFVALAAADLPKLVLSAQQILSQATAHFSHHST